ncbi:membrane protein [Gordonia phage Neville]|uniref:Membrane protein n=1 Tax=Gordonia phage Neville TaxID=2301693 RepID=A0A385DYK6_9CAUD|nr:membrane protein [Gordonia phage Neville]AXQ64484.1 membrane protein [Gordonia phage Neville]
MSDILWVILITVVVVFLILARYGKHLEDHPERSAIGKKLIDQHGQTVEVVTREAFQRGLAQERAKWNAWLDNEPELDEPELDEPELDELDGDEPDDEPTDADDEPRPWTDLLDN